MCVLNERKSYLDVSFRYEANLRVRFDSRREVVEIVTKEEEVVVEVVESTSCVEHFRIVLSFSIFPYTFSCPSLT